MNRNKEVELTLNNIENIIDSEGTESLYSYENFNPGWETTDKILYTSQIVFNEQNKTIV